MVEIELVIKKEADDKDNGIIDLANSMRYIENRIREGYISGENWELNINRP